MTERAWEVMLALAANKIDRSDPRVNELGEAAERAIKKYRLLPSGLQPPKQPTCADPVLSQLTWAPPPAPSTALRDISQPISLAYLLINDCGIDPFWTAGPFFDQINKASPNDPASHPDYSGVVLAFWAHQPDDEENDWHVFLRPTNSAFLSFIKDALETAGAAAAGTVWLPLHCAVECMSDFLGLGGSCEVCIRHAVEDSQNAAHEGVADLDGLIPGFLDVHSAEYLSGMGHHLNVAPLPPPGLNDFWKIHPDQYDDRPGMLTENAGPIGIPDPVEFAAMVVADYWGVSVHYEPSTGPDQYQITNMYDHHPDTVMRDENDWQLLSFAHTPFTPIDNLAAYGWREFRSNPSQNLPKLGWALHAFGDAIVPMHVVGTFGYGHRPYEDAFASKLRDYLYSDSERFAAVKAHTLAAKAADWRKFILDWRAQHPHRVKDVPVRDMITELARRTLQTVEGPSMFQWPFSPVTSTEYLMTPAGKGATIFYYNNVPLVDADDINKDLLLDGIAAEIAFLVSAAEDFE